MGFAVPVLTTFAHPLDAIARWISPRPHRPRAMPAVARMLVPQPAPAVAARMPRPALPRPALRVMIRAQEGGHPRLVISGRMADVCAELERMAL